MTEKIQKVISIASDKKYRVNFRKKEPLVRMGLIYARRSRRNILDYDFNQMLIASIIVICNKGYLIRGINDQTEIPKNSKNSRSFYSALRYFF
jgi:hypothetical protein